MPLKWFFSLILSYENFFSCHYQTKPQKSSEKILSSMKTVWTKERFCIKILLTFTICFLHSWKIIYKKLIFCCSSFCNSMKYLWCPDLKHFYGIFVSLLKTTRISFCILNYILIYLWGMRHFLVEWFLWYSKFLSA